jgi:hypothetical protein
VLAGVAIVVFLSWVILGIDGARVTLQVDDIGQWVAAWCATAVCGVAAFRASTGRATWALLAASSFAWGVGEAVWCYYALLKDISVPFPSLADVGFLTAVPLAFAALLLFASWATVLGPLYRSHQGGLLKQVISLAYPMSDVIMVSLVIILIARGGRPVRVHLVLVMAGVVAFAVADSSFTYLTEVNNYTGGSFLDTGWVAGYLLIGLGALWAMTSPSHETEHVEASTISLVAPYVPVLVVLAVTGIQLLRGRQMEPVSWIMAFALVLLVLGREILRLLDQAVTARNDPHDLESVDDLTRSRDPNVETALLGGGEA